MDDYLEKFKALWVETPDEFLRTLDIFSIGDPQVIYQLKKLASKSTRIGEESGVGKIYKLSESLVLKISEICTPNMSTNLAKLCNMAKRGDLIYRIPNSETGKLTVYAPGYLLEGIIGIMLSQLRVYTPSFMHVELFQYDRNDPAHPVYMVQELLTPIKSRIATVQDLVHTTMQIAHALYVAQETNRYVHYDLHHGNIMARPTNKIRVYELGNGKYYYTMIDFDAVIIDYGHNRLETAGTALISQMIMWRDNPGREILDYYDFNPYYDLFSFINSTRMGISSGDYTLKLSKESQNAILMIYSAFLNPAPMIYDFSIMKTFAENCVDHISQGMWRPYPELLAMSWTDHDTGTSFRSARANEFLANMSKLIENSSSFSGSKTSAHDIYTYLKTNRYMISDQLVQVTPDTKVYRLPDKEERLDTTFYRYIIKDTDTFDDVINIRRHDPFNPLDILKDIRTEYAWYNMTKSSLSPTSQYIHIAEINVNEGRKSGYQFRFDCCRIDMRNYLQSPDIKAGIVMNASYFHILEGDRSFLPIGIYKTDDFSSNEPIPKEYAQYYGVVGIDDSGVLHIDYLNNVNNYVYALTVGPILVWKRELEMTAEVLADPYYQCTNDASLVHIKNCSDIKPGELYHASNPNPRSALGLLPNGNVLLVHVEGRANRGAGMDLEQLARLMYNLGAVDAINLDGGRSSQLMWRVPGQKQINIAGHTDQAYPVGNVIAYTKRV